MSLKALLDSLPIPIVQAPMAGSSTPEMALAVSRAGGLGSLAATFLSAADIEPAVAAFRAQTDAPFGVNLLVSQPLQPEAAEVEAAIERLKPWYAAAGIEPPAVPNTFVHQFDAQVEALARAAPPVASFAFGPITREQVDLLHDAGCYVVGTANTVAEARAWAELGADGICAQGMEAGGHRGNWLKPVGESLIGTLALVATVRAAVDLPVIAAGGIMDGRGVAAALALGASAAQMGSAFLLAEESMVHSAARKAMRDAGDDATGLTRAFTGRHARGVVNRFMREMAAVEDEVPAYPIQARLTQPLRGAGNPDAMPLWAGQAISLAGAGASGELVLRWWNEARAAAGEVTARTRGGPGGTPGLETDPEAGC